MVASSSFLQPHSPHPLGCTSGYCECGTSCWFGSRNDGRSVTLQFHEWCLKVIFLSVYNVHVLF